MNKNRIFPYSRLSAITTVYGCYSVLCHAVFVLFYSVTSHNTLTDYITARRIAEFLEHTLMSLVIVIIGGFLIDYTLKQQKK